MGLAGGCCYFGVLTPTILPVGESWIKIEITEVQQKITHPANRLNITCLSFLQAVNVKQTLPKLEHRNERRV